MTSKYKIKKSENGHQFFVMTQYEGKFKIDKVFYSEARAEEYIKVSTIVDAVIDKEKQ